MRWHSANKGFTLLEVLISMFLLVVISIATYQASTQTFRLREVLSVEGEFYNSIRLAVSILQRDLENAYSPVIIRPEQTARNGKGSTEAVSSASFPAQTRDVTQSDYFSSEIDKFGIRSTRLSGTDSKLLWVSAANTRMYRDSSESIFAKIRYSIEPETDKEYEAGSSTLIRTASTKAFIYNEDRDDSVKKYPLLHGIRKLKFRYYRKDKDQWFDSWDSESYDNKDFFPDIIELQLEVAAPKGLRFEGRYRIRPEVPLHGVPSTL